MTPRKTPPKLSHEVPLRFPIDCAPKPGCLIEAAPGVLWARFPLPYQLNHVNVYLLEDDGGWAVFDAATDGQENRELWTALLRDGLGGRPITRIIASHFHPDHLGATGWLSRTTGAPVVMSGREYVAARRMSAEPIEDYLTLLNGHFTRHGIAMEDNIAQKGGQHDYGAFISDLPEEVTYVAEGDSIRIGGRQFHVLTGSGHSPELVMLYDAADRLLICADQVLARISPNISVMPDAPRANPLHDYLRSITELRTNVSDDVMVLPGHELPFFGLHARIDQLVNHHQLRCAETLMACQNRAATARDLIPTIFGRDFNGESLGIAIGEAIAHTNFLVAEGQLEEVLRDGQVLYRLSE
ncbi:MBL fold metallo-hydrolase [Chelativorans sp. Marseille-P2723]|uniref:MBL fold metallo-hydrolase n=1 Tax=Chelativorans sp. Marseille-P2723 TaxID=2709133 RepID=UPI00156D6391|nr:MBL fold metallo-hydrolase [Chelativorans sp. Marseille-P2723]